MGGFRTRGGAIMKHYAGLDVSLDETSVCIVEDTGIYVYIVVRANTGLHILKLIGEAVAISSQ